jgi:ribosomal protein S18 acetylase RimI-like enzyme
MPARIASPEDRDLLVELGRRTFFDTFVGTCTDEDMALFLDTSFAPDKVATELAAPESSFLVWEDEGGACGYSRLMGEREGRVELVRFYMDQRVIGTGAAHALMEETLRLAREQGYREIYLGVWEKNIRAQNFYRRWGFEKTGEKVFMVGNDPQTDWWFERRL